MTNLSDVLARIVDIANDLSSIGLADDEYPVSLVGNLPFLFVYEDEGRYQQLDADTWRFTRDFTALLYIQEFNPENATQEAAARVAARPFLVSYPRHFLARNRLQRNDQGLNGIVSATLSEDRGIQSASRDMHIYTAIYFHHVIVYDEQILVV